jgi:uncharacterized Zn finger protein
MIQDSKLLCPQCGGDGLCPEGMEVQTGSRSYCVGLRFGCEECGQVHRLWIEKADSSIGTTARWDFVEDRSNQPAT